MKDTILKYYTWAQIWREEEGQDLIEYALLAALIAVACVASMTSVRTAIITKFTAIVTALNAA
jgi:pilus assembly protein Flp/PilA